MLVFVSGGARSGKSEVAERNAQQAAQSGSCYYIATATAYDAEMLDRVARHRASRNGQWVTLEAPLALDQAIAQVPDGQPVLIDCLTLWASQVLYSAGLSEAEGMALFVRSLHDAHARGLHLVIVSNDLNEDLLPSNTETWRYIEFLQRLHRRLAAEAGSVLEVVAGYSIEWKTGENQP